jgi:hypothetical protein
MKKWRRSLFLIAVVACVAVCLLLLWRADTLQAGNRNYSLIEPGLYMGGHVQKPPPGTKAVLNLCELENSYKVEHQDWDSTRDAEPAPDLKWLRKHVEFIDTHLKAGRTTFVHCRNGASRSGFVVVAYLMYKKNWTRDEALKFARTKRDITRPNPAFMDRLKEWEAALKETSKK